jgi:serine phosphatase RsbU (regulator of sigma subunit)
VARWRAATSEFTWVSCGHQYGFLADTACVLTSLEGPTHQPLGDHDGTGEFTPTARRLGSGERLILVTDGITERRTESGGHFGAEGITAALESLGDATAAATAMAILQGVTECWREPLEDDGTVVVLRVD